MIRMVIFSFSMFATLVCTSTCQQSESEIIEKPEMLEKDTLTYLALGDSYTIGESVAVEERWPVQLADKASDEIDKPFKTKIIAKTGWSTGQLKQGIADANISGQSFDFVSILIGVNNQYRGISLDIYIKEFEELLNQAIIFAGQDTAKVFVVSIPDYGVTPFASGMNKEKIARELDAYNAINKQISEKYNVAWFDITPISREAVNDRELIATDGLHPSGKMYKRWVDEVIYEKFSEKLNKATD